jgi:GxxExxY protein
VSENEITERVIGCAIKVHAALGPGLLESAYESCLYYDLFKAGFFVERQKPVPLFYKEIRMDCGYRADLIVERKVIVEIKSVEALNEIHLMQTITHLKLTTCKVGLLLNFNVLKLRDGIWTVANHFDGVKEH